ncbi:MAG: hypothetical protein ACRDNF_14305 [Streptosporangiaceae bacterium]
MRRFKYQALITPKPPEVGRAALPGPACRVVIRARHHETGHSRLFPALVSTSEDTQPANREILASLVVTGDDAPDWLAPGDSFTVWREGPAGDGVITRRLFV